AEPAIEKNADVESIEDILADLDMSSVEEDEQNEVLAALDAIEVIEIVSTAELPTPETGQTRLEANKALIGDYHRRKEEKRRARKAVKGCDRVRKHRAAKHI